MSKFSVAVMRHGNAEDDFTFSSDFERNLTSKGKIESNETAAWLQEIGFTPDVILCSAAARTKQTAEVCAANFDIKFDAIIAAKEMYNSGSGNYFRALSKLTEYNKILLIGHNPTICEIVDHFSTENDIFSFPTASVAIIEINKDNLKIGEITGLKIRNKNN